MRIEGSCEQSGENHQQESRPDGQERSLATKVRPTPSRRRFSAPDQRKIQESLKHLMTCPSGQAQQPRSSRSELALPSGESGSSGQTRRTRPFEPRFHLGATGTTATVSKPSCSRAPIPHSVSSAICVEKASALLAVRLLAASSRAWRLSADRGAHEPLTSRVLAALGPVRSTRQETSRPTAVPRR